MSDTQFRENITMTFRQKMFVRYLMAILIDLVILNLFDEFLNSVNIPSFSISIFVALILQILLRITLAIEHRVANYFKSKPGKINVVLRFLTGWLILFGSKFLILYLLDLIFGDKVVFESVIVFIVVVVAVVVSEETIRAIFNLSWMKQNKKQKMTD